MLQAPKLLSNTQSQTSYPNGPSWKHPPRNSRVGGYVVDNATCVAWGARILDEPLDPEKENDSIAAFSAIVSKLKERPYFTKFAMFGPESFKQYMVVTQSSLFRGWVGMNPQFIPKFEEGRREAIARELLDAEGAFTMFLLHSMPLVSTL
jgi:hypothetical protein